MNHQFRSQASGDGCSTSSCRRDSGVDASKIPLRTTPGRRLKDSRTVPLQRGAEAISRLHEKSEAGHRMLDTQLETVARKIRRNSIKMGIASFAAGAGPPPDHFVSAPARLMTGLRAQDLGAVGARTRRARARTAGVGTVMLIPCR